MDPVAIRPMVAADRLAVGELICVSTNYWYETHAMARIFPEAAGTDVFWEVYAALPGSAGLVAMVGARLAGSCFYHERPTHLSLGIMNVHPNFFGHGVARALLAHIIAAAERAGKPLRLVSSALNLDSFSLYTRAGFVPRCLYQDIALAVPASGLGAHAELEACVRPAEVADVARMAAVEMAVSGIQRGGDYEHFVRNDAGIWHVSVCAAADGSLDGYLVSGPTMVGPGVARTEAAAAALLLAELDRRRGRTSVFLVPAACEELVRRAYAWGGRNCELHVAQARGECPPFRGVTMPSFLPETG